MRPADDVPFPFSEGMGVWFVPPPLEGPRLGSIQQIRVTPKGQVVHISGFDSAQTARDLVGKTVSVRSADAPEGWDDEEPTLVGMLVVDEARGELGTIEEVIVTGANDVWVVVGDHYGEVLVPVIDDVVISFDEERGELGTIEEVIVTGANDVWVVVGDRYGEVLVPVIDDVVLSFDEAADTVNVRLLPGLIEGE